MTPGATSVTTRRPRVTTTAAALAAVALAAPVSACSFWAPDITVVSYAPGDGLNAELPDLWVRNLLVVGQAEDGAGVLSGGLYNQTGEDLDVVVVAGEGGTGTTLTIPAEGRLLLTAPGQGGGQDGAEGGGDGEEVPPEAHGSGVVEVVLVDPVGVAPGFTVPVSITTPEYGELVLDPPVTLPTGEYEGFLDEVPNAQGSGPPLEELVELQEAPVDGSGGGGSESGEGESTEGGE